MSNIYQLNQLPEGQYLELKQKRIRERQKLNDDNLLFPPRYDKNCKLGCIQGYQNINPTAWCLCVKK